MWAFKSGCLALPLRLCEQLTLLEPQPLPVGEGWVLFVNWGPIPN